ncbi:MAG: glutathione S-transferase family protein [Alphaproteobacteria bacterium]|nr:glutathione S-transferase family protein [Alphaproteobacteria bacterium]
MITLYGCYRSRATRPLWALFETGLAFVHHPTIQAYRLADPHAADAPENTASPAFLAVNPMGQIPASDAETALMQQWALFASTAIEGPALDIAMTITKGQDKTAEGAALVARAADLLRRPLARLEAHLTGKDWLLGGRFTAADIMAEECVRYAQPHPTLLSEYPAVNAWIARCQARPAFQKMWAGRLAEPA